MFVGVSLPHDFSLRLSAACSRLRDAEPAWRDQKWVATENLHLTLAFFGDVEESAEKDLNESLARVSLEHAPFELPFDRLRAVPSERRCRMIWAAFLDDNGSSGRLADDIRRASPFPVVAGRSEVFRPHATLCRARHPMRLDRVNFSMTTARQVDWPMTSAGRPPYLSWRGAPRCFALMRRCVAPAIRCASTA